MHVSVRAADAPTSELPIADTDTRRAAITGIAWGALGGLVAVFVSAFLGLRMISVDAPTIAFALVAGIVLGMLAGALFGSANPTAALETLRLAAARGGVIIVVEADAAVDRTEAARIFDEHAGARVETEWLGRPALGPA